MVVGIYHMDIILAILYFCHLLSGIFKLVVA
jgi:hypothetical protein